MDELKDLLNEFFNKDCRFHNKDEIIKKLNVKGEEKQDILDRALLELEEDGILFNDKKKGYRIFPKNEGFAFGKIQINKAGTGFVHTKDGYTILIENCDLNGAMDGDNVIVYNILNKRKDYFHGEIYRITKRYSGNMIFEVIGNGKNASLVACNNLENINVNVDISNYKNLIEGNLLLVNISKDSRDGVFDGDVVSIIGHRDDPDIDTRVIFCKYNIPVDFSDECLNEANNIQDSVKEEDLIGRVDLRSENILTIDRDNTKDKDDAIGIKKKDNGNYLLKVNIAHLTYFIKYGSYLYNEALVRCFSHYLGDTCNPMFPRSISNGICSLNANCDRLTKTFELEIDKDGNIVDYNIYNSVICSKKEMFASNVNKVLDGEYVEGYSEYSYELNLLKDLNVILENARKNRDYLNFNTLEINSFKDKDGRILGFSPDNMGLSGQIVENTMLVTNHIAYRHLSWFLLCYRVHECPNQESVREVISILRASNIKIPNVKNVDSRSLKMVIDSLGDNDVSLIAKECLLRSMKKAVYDTNNVGHFALQYDIYGHATAPIRRIIDYIYMLILDNIDKFDFADKSYKEFEEFLNNICIRVNEIEKISKIMEDEYLDMEMAKYMEDHIGEEYDVIVTELGKSAMLVRTNNYIRGKIKFDDMLDDYYYFDYDKHCVIGRNTKKRYYIGCKEKVILKNASKINRTVDFQIGDVKKLKKIR